jgi:glyoxylase-like metal-dependent hydrolase (beta-lactamase superfamily II)
MAEWLASLDKLKREVPADVLVLPAHGEAFRGLHTRIDALARGQEIAFERLKRSLAEPKRVVDLFGALFARRIDQSEVSLLGMATGLLGLIPIVPWLAHASWHAYRDLVNPVGLETRPWT